MSLKNPVNDAWKKEWAAYAKKMKLPGADKAITNDPMEATYVGMMMWKQAVEKAKSTDPDKVIAAMAGQTFASPNGFTMKMDETNHHLWKPVFIGEIQADGQFKVVWKTKGTIRAQPWSPFIPETRARRTRPKRSNRNEGLRKSRKWVGQPAGAGAADTVHRDRCRCPLPVFFGLTPCADWKLRVDAMGNGVRRTEMGAGARRVVVGDLRAGACPAPLIKDLAFGESDAKIEAIGTLVGSGDSAASAVPSVAAGRRGADLGRGSRPGRQGRRRRRRNHGQGGRAAPRDA